MVLHIWPHVESLTHSLAFKSPLWHLSGGRSKGWIRGLVMAKPRSILIFFTVPMALHQILHSGQCLLAPGSGLMRGPQSSAEQVSPESPPVFPWQSDVSGGHRYSAWGAKSWGKQTVYQDLITGCTYTLCHIHLRPRAMLSLFLMRTFFLLCPTCMHSENLSTLSPFMTFHYAVIQKGRNQI